ncbi:MAG: hypothetical protein P8M12_02365 [Flavobacteriales bacterium]|nr:hypothetical protein [Flavobacteriales bacterium]
MKKNINNFFIYKIFSPYPTLVRTFFLAIFFNLFSINFSAQFIDSISENIYSNSVFFIKIDTRGSFVSNRHVRINGIKGGVCFNEQLKIGVGYNWLKTNYLPIYNGENVNLKSHNVSTFVDYIFIKKKPFEFNANVQIAIGNVQYKQNQIRLANSIAFFYEQSITAEYRVLKYLGLGFGLGYRFVVYNKTAINEKLSAPVYIARLKLYFGDIYKDLKEK